MPVSHNRVTLAGTLTRDPEVRFFSNERAVANFGLAINRKYRGGDGETKEETTFVDIECWGRIAELCGQYLTKGKQALIEGRLRLDTWEDKGGSKRSKLKIVAETVQFLSSSKPTEKREAPEPGTGPGRSVQLEQHNDDEPPF